MRAINARIIFELNKGKTMTKNKQSIFISIFVTVLYAIITLICVFHHEIWSDEAQVWMLCKHISFFGLFKHLTNEGHPSFFYLLVMPFAKLFNNIIWMQLICWISSVAAVFLLWRYSGFNSWLKSAITLSAPFIYFFPVVARSYSVIPVLVFLLAIFQTRNKKHPVIYSLILVLLANTHVIMGLFCALLWLMFMYDNLYLPYKQKTFNKKYILPSVVMFAGLLALGLQLMGTTSSNAFIGFEETDYLADFSRIVMLFIFNSLSAYYVKSHANYFDNPIMNLSIILFIVLFVLLVVNLFKNSKKYFALFSLSFTFQILVYLLVYNRIIFPTRIFVSWCILLFCFWVLVDEGKFKDKFISCKKTTEILLFLFFAMVIPNGITAYYGDIVLDYTASKKTASFIETNIDLNKAMIITDYPYLAVAINYYLQPKYDLYAAHDGKRFKYIYWAKNINTYMIEDAWRMYIEMIRKTNPDKDLYVLTCYSPYRKLFIDEHVWEDFDLLYITGDSLEPYEKFKLYKYTK